MLFVSDQNSEKKNTGKNIQVFKEKLTLLPGGDTPARFPVPLPLSTMETPPLPPRSPTPLGVVLTEEGNRAPVGLFEALVPLLWELLVVGAFMLLARRHLTPILGVTDPPAEEPDGDTPCVLPPLRKNVNVESTVVKNCKS